ncbi:MAG: PAS domain S-box protein, partial [Bradymonadaceae bacterium]|nr:PAS domain S-box protein [Lujinxingiaceae bacterium]
MAATSSPRIPLINSAMVGHFLAPELREAQSHEAYHQRAVILVVLVSGIWGPIFGIFFGHVLGSPSMGVASMTTVLASFAVLNLVRLTRSVWWSSQIVCGLLLCLLISSVVQTGGIASASLAWLIFVPVMASFFLKRGRWTFVWAGMALCVLAGLFAAQILGWQPSNILEFPWQRQLHAVISTSSLLIAMLLMFAIHLEIETWALDSARAEEQRLRRAHQEASEQSRESLLALIEHSPEGIAIHREGALVYANPAFCELAGYEELDMESMALSDLLRVEPSGGEEFQLVRREGAPLAVEVTEFPATFERTRVLISIVRDLSERRELHAKMMQMDRMIAVGVLASGVAHEINNPLAFVHSNLEFVIRQIGDEADAEKLARLPVVEVRESLKDALTGTLRIRDIVSDLKTFALDGQQRSVPMELEQILESAIKMALGQIRQRAQVVRDFAQVPAIISDPSGLAQVFLNLLVNAAQAIPEGSPETNTIRVSSRLVAGEVIVEISDTGTGISEENLSRIFDPFVTSKSRDQGMGLGLSICRNIMRKLGGRIEVESTPGQGSTFRVHWPAELIEEAAGEALDVSRLGPSSGRVVIIDDERMLLRALARQLGREFQVETYESAREALEHLGLGVLPHVILCDLQMPELSGAQFYRQLLATRPDLAARVIFMTGGAFTNE